MSETIQKLQLKLMATFYDKQEQWLTDQMLQDMQDNPEKYKGAVFYPIEREKVIDLIKKGQNTEKLQTQKAIECLKEVKDRFCLSGIIFHADCGFTQKEKDLILNTRKEDNEYLADIIDIKIKELEGEKDVKKT